MSKILKLFNYLFNFPVNRVFWGSNIVLSNALIFQQWIYSTLGAVIIGWGIFMTFVSTHAFRQKEKWAWNCFAVSIFIWYFEDTFLSIFYQVYTNIIFNTIIFLAIALPLIFTKRYFK